MVMGGGEPHNESTWELVIDAFPPESSSRLPRGRNTILELSIAGDSQGTL